MFVQYCFKPSNSFIVSNNSSLLRIILFGLLKERTRTSRRVNKSSFIPWKRIEWCLILSLLILNGCKDLRFLVFMDFSLVFGFLSFWLISNNIGMAICLFWDKRLLLILEQCNIVLYYITFISSPFYRFVCPTIFIFCTYTFYSTINVWKFFDEYGKQCRTNLRLEKIRSWLLILRFPINIRHYIILFQNK